MRKIFLCLFVTLTCTSCKEKLLYNVSEVDSAKIISRLTDDNISVEREIQADGKFSILVESTDTPKAIKVLQEARLLSRTETESAGAGVGASREEQKFSFERQASTEIEKTLVSIDGVLDARVHLNMPSVDPIFGQKLSQSNGSASVLLILSEDAEIDVTQVSQLVAGASGVLPSQVSVMKTISHEVTAPTHEIMLRVDRDQDPQLEKIVSIVFLSLVGIIAVVLGLKKRGVSHAMG